jgi:hypothetical protein
MQPYSSPHLQKYKGISTRHSCPECGQKQSFTLYLDGKTNEPIHCKVGKCNRESKCGYHYTPKQFYNDNPSISIDTTSLNGCWDKSKPIVPLIPPGTIPFSFVERSVSYKSNFVRFLCEILTDEQIQAIGENYALGATKTSEVIFWQIDIQGKVRTGKIMQYNPDTGRRLKHESGAIDWVHNKLKKIGTLPEDFNLKQCFFGEHLLKLYPEKTVAIVESEKSALIASAVFPDLVWLSAGNIHGLSIEKCEVLRSRNTILFPDLNAFDKWSEKAIHIKKVYNCNITVSSLLEDIATPEAKANGLDIADYLIEQLRKRNQEPLQAIQSDFTPELELMIDRNKALLVLINGLNLEEV